MSRLFSAASIAVLVAFAGSPALADDARIQVEAALLPKTLGPGDRARLTVKISVPDSWHLWSFQPGEGPLPLKIAWAKSTPLQFVGEWFGPAPHEVFDRGFKRKLLQYEAGEFVFERYVELHDAKIEGPQVFTLKVRGQICTDELCINQRLTPGVDAVVSGTGLGKQPPELNGKALTGKNVITKAEAHPGFSPSTNTANKVVGPDNALNLSSDAAALEAAKREGIFSFLLLAFLAGLGALATPCVFPAIPMTVSFFSKYSEKSFGHGARLAGFYAISMMLFFTIGGMLVSAIFGVTGLQSFAAHPVFNLTLAAILIFFALSLMGWFKIETPMWAYRITNKLEMKYGPNATANSDKPKGVFGDYVAVGVAAATSTTVFFTCTVAFVGLVLVAAADGEWFWPTLGMLAFSSAFVLPFFLLAMFPAAASKLRGKSGNWIKAISVTLGFVEMAAALKFISNADLVWQYYFLSRDVVLSIWIVLFAVLGLFLIGKLDMRAADEPPPDEFVSVPRVMVGMTVFAFALYLSLALFENRPLSGWVNGWLPPSVFPGQSARNSNSNGNSVAAFHWIHDLDKGREQANLEGKLVFVNYTGYTCTNCRYMESGVFPRAEIARLLNDMILVELYTDGLSDQDEANRQDQLQRFKTAALPFYVVEKPDGTVIATFPSSTNDPDEFRQFLASAIKKAGAVTKASARSAFKASSVKLSTMRLSDSKKIPALVDGRWSLVNFWATWCAPCRKELEGFLVALGKDFESKGGRFAAVAIEEEESVPAALAFMKKINVPDDSALRLPSDLESAEIDPALGLTGYELPYTVLVSPMGEVVWKHQGLLEEAALKTLLSTHTGLSL